MILRRKFAALLAVNLLLQATLCGAVDARPKSRPKASLHRKGQRNLPPPTLCKSATSPKSIEDYSQIEQFLEEIPISELANRSASYVVTYDTREPANSLDSTNTTNGLKVKLRPLPSQKP